MLRPKQGRIISEMFSRAARQSADMARERDRRKGAVMLRYLTASLLHFRGGRPQPLGDGRRAIKKITQDCADD